MGDPVSDFVAEEVVSDFVGDIAVDAAAGGAVDAGAAGAAGAFDAAGVGTGVDAGIAASDAGLAASGDVALGASVPAAAGVGGDAAAAVGGASGLTADSPGAAGAFDAAGTGTGVDAGIGVSDAGLAALESGAGTGSVGTGMVSGAGGDFGSGVEDELARGWEGAVADSSNQNAALETAGDVGKAAAGGKVTQDTLDKILKYAPLPLLAAGTLQQRQAVKKASSQIGQLGGPQRDVGTKLVQDFQNGTLNPADMAAIDEWKRGAIAQSRQYFAKAGLSDSTAALKAEQDINAKAEAMGQQARQNLLATGLNALNITDKFQAAAIDAELKGDLQTANAAGNFLTAYGSWLRALPVLTGSGGTKTPPAQ